MGYIAIPQNPYIVGNPIQSQKMFFGRNEDFMYVRDKLEQETKGLIITLAGERRSGKTSILFQIMNGRLGEEYLPFFIDMQAMASVESDSQFLARLDQAMRFNLQQEIPMFDYEENGWNAFEQFVAAIKTAYPGRKLILLLDEYELIESKIDKKLITEEIVTFFANLMENHGVYFLFTGSNKLEERTALYWKTLFSKSQYRKITFLKHNDCLDLIAKPVEGYVNYTPEQLDKVWRLTAGQPFYTQIFCQNMVDRLQIEQHNDVLEEDIDAVIADIVDNPMPQMIYFWQELDAKHKLTMSLMAELLNTKEDWLECEELMQLLKNQKLNLNITTKDFHTAMEELYHKDILSKKGKQYQFRVDIFRFWVKQEQNVWKLLREINLDKEPEPATRRLALGIALISILVIICAGTLYFVLKPTQEFGSSHNRSATAQYKQAQSFFEDNNYPQALETVNEAIKADSLYFRAHLLKAEILKAMRRVPEALAQYERSEEVYNKVASNIGKLIGTIPKEVVTDKSTAIYTTNNNFLIYDTWFDAYLYGLNRPAPEKYRGSDMHTFYFPKRKWYTFPTSYHLETRSNILIYYNYVDNTIVSFDAKKGTQLWKSKLPNLPQQSRYLFVEFGRIIDIKAHYIEIHNRQHLFILDTKSGKLIYQNTLSGEEYNNVHYLSKTDKIIVSTSKTRTVYQLPDMKKLCQQQIEDGNDIGVEDFNGTLISCSYNNITKLNYYSEKLNRLIELPLEDLVFRKYAEISKNYLIYIRNGKTYKYIYKDDQEIEIPQLKTVKAEYLHQDLIKNEKSTELVIQTKDEFVIFNTKHNKILCRVSLKKIPSIDPSQHFDFVMYYGKKKLLFFFYPEMKDNSETGMYSVNIFDLKQNKIIFTNRVNKQFLAATMSNKVYFAITGEENFDGNKLSFIYRSLFINPKTFDMQVVDNIDFYWYLKGKSIFLLKNAIYQVDKFPQQDVRSLQKIHENLILLYDQFKRQDKVVDVFLRMQAYLKNISNTSVATAIADALAEKLPAQIGFYAEKLLNIVSDFKAIQPIMEKVMQITPNTTMPALKLPRRNYIDIKKDDIYIVEYDESFVNLTVNKLVGNHLVRILEWTKSVPGFYRGIYTYLYSHPGRKPVFHLMDRKTDAVYSYPPPFKIGTRASTIWLNEEEVAIVTQKQLKTGFHYELSTMQKSDGKTSLLKQWDSKLHLRRLISYQGKLGFVWTDSLTSFCYLKSDETQTPLPPFATILTLNGKKVTTIGQLTNADTPVCNLEYESGNIKQKITLSAQQFATLKFSPMEYRQLQWFDPQANDFERPMLLQTPFFTTDNAIATDDIENYIVNGFLMENDEQEVDFITYSIDLKKGTVVDYRVFLHTESISSNVQIFGDRVYYSNYFNQALQVTCIQLGKDGKFYLKWHQVFPYMYIVTHYTTSEYTLCQVGTKAGGEQYSIYLELNSRTGEVIKSYPVYQNMMALNFETKPPLLYHPHLGFYDFNIGSLTADKKR